MPVQTLSLKAVNRATLARQLLLAREKITPLRAIERLVGLQAQEARPPFIGLWTRLEAFERAHLAKLLHARKVVRATTMRGTIHLMSAKDFLAFRPTIQPALTAGMLSVLRDRAKQLDLEGLVSMSREFFDERHRTFDDLRKYITAKKLNGDVRAMAYAVRTHLPLVQVPTDDSWAFPTAADFAVADTWLGVKMDIPKTPRPVADAETEALILRYLAAFGPATPADAQAWSGLKNLAEHFERLKKKLRVFKDERGRELYDLPKAPRPSEDTPAPIRLLPEYDNLVLSHVDRTRIIADKHRPVLVTKNLRVRATFLIDGFAAGTWKVDRAKTAAKLTLDPFESLPKAARGLVLEEAGRLLQFVEPDAARHECAVA